MPITDDIEIEKLDIIRKMFVAPADDTYVVARWCYLNGLAHEASWNSLHAVEKYLKACLLANGQSTKSKDFGHNIENLFVAGREIAGDLLLTEFQPTEGISANDWEVETVADFVKRLNCVGSPDARYRVDEAIIRRHDMFKLDQLVYSIRRVAFPLNRDIRRSDAPPNYPKTAREYIERSPAVGHLIGQFPQIRRGSCAEDYDGASLLGNGPFGGDVSSIEKSGTGVAFVASVLIQTFFQLDVPFDSLGRKRMKLFRDLRDWVVGNIKLSKEDKMTLMNFEDHWAERVEKRLVAEAAVDSDH